MIQITPMNRRRFLVRIAASTALLPGIVIPSHRLNAQLTPAPAPQPKPAGGYRADLVIAGAGLGGCAAAWTALRSGLRVVLTEETDWIGGQLTQQGVPPDEHRWIEAFGATRTYRDLRVQIRDYYRRHYPLTESARARRNLNPGDGTVSRLCHEPRVALAVLHSLFAPFLSSAQLTLLLQHRVIAAEIQHDRVTALSAQSLLSGRALTLQAPWFIDATELGDLLPLTGTEFVTGTESRRQTGELHAPVHPNPANQQAFTICMAIDYSPGENHTIDPPQDYPFWRDFVPQLAPPWPGRLLDLAYTHPPTGQPRTLGFNPEGPTPDAPVNLWTYRRIAHAANFSPGTYAGDISLVNWPQNDYLLGNLVGVSPAEATRHIAQAKQLTLSLLYWLQTAAPRPDGGTGWPSLRLRPDVLGTEDGLAKYPYVREARRIQAVFTVLEGHVGRAQRGAVTGQPETEVTAAPFPDSVGIGSYPIDLHPTTAGDNYIDFPALPFQIPLGALLPVRTRNLIPAAKNIGTTHVTNGCYRLHPVEWNIGEAAGALASFAHQQHAQPHQIRETPALLAQFQNRLRALGVDTHWPNPITDHQSP
jgi:hypothetical protein